MQRESPHFCNATRCSCDDSSTVTSQSAIIFSNLLRSKLSTRKIWSQTTSTGTACSSTQSANPAGRLRAISVGRIRRIVARRIRIVARRVTRPHLNPSTCHRMESRISDSNDVNFIAVTTDSRPTKTQHSQTARDERLPPVQLTVQIVTDSPRRLYRPSRTEVGTSASAVADPVSRVVSSPGPVMIQ